MSRKLRVAVVNPLTITGREIRARLRERQFPISEVDLFDSGQSSAGALTDEDGEAAYVAAIDEDSLGSSDVVFLCEPDEPASRFAAEAARQGAIVVEVAADGIGTFPVAIVGVDDTAIPKGVPLAARSPSASAVLVSRVIAPLRALGKLSRLSITQLEPASLLGDPALEELLGQAVGLLNFRPLPKNVFGRQMAWNVFADPSRGTGLPEELRTILHIDVPIAVTSLRGPSFHGHGFSMLAEWSGGAVASERLAAAISGTPGLELHEGEFIPGTVEAAGTDETHVVLLGPDPAIAGSQRLWVVADHLREGPALNAIRLAETMAGLPGPGPTTVPRLRRGRTS